MNCMISLAFLGFKFIFYLVSGEVQLAKLQSTATISAETKYLTTTVKSLPDDDGYTGELKFISYNS